MPKITVLLSTWNGMAYLPQQIASIFSQDVDASVVLLVRDDGSTDGTLEYLRGLDRRVTVVEGSNIGPRASFLALLDLSKTLDSDYFALCDQDDVWDPHKLSQAVTHLASATPTLYASGLNLVDQELRPIRKFVHPGDRSFAATLMCNFVTGCTCVLNRAFVERMPMPPDPAKIIMHDWWLASVATVIGTVHYDRSSLIAYRQHASNHVGIASGLGGFVTKLISVVTTKPIASRFDHARQVRLALSSDMNESQRRTIDAFLAGEHSAPLRAHFSARYIRSSGVKAALRFAFWS